MDELDRNLERQMRSQERQLMAVRLTLAALAAIALVAFRETLPSTPTLLALVGAVVVYSLALWWLSNRFAVEGEVDDIVTASPFRRSDFPALNFGGVKIPKTHNVHTTAGIRYRF